MGRNVQYSIVDRLDLSERNPYPPCSQGYPKVESELMTLALLGDMRAQELLQSTYSPYGDAWGILPRLDSALTSKGLLLLSAIKIDTGSTGLSERTAPEGFEIICSLGGQIDTMRWIQILLPTTQAPTAIVFEAQIKWAGRLSAAQPSIFEHNSYAVEATKFRALEQLLNSS